MPSLFPSVPEKLHLGAYPYTFARVSAMKGKLVRAEDYHKLLKMPLAEIAKFLEEREYKKEIDALAAQQSGAALLTQALEHHFSNVVEKLRRISDEELVLMMDAYLLRRDIANIKTMLRGKRQGLGAAQIKATLQAGILPMRIIDQLLQAQTAEQLLSHIATLGIPDLAQGKEPAQIEHALDTAYYRRLLAIALLLPTQGQLFADFLRRELDNRNLFTMLRLRQAKLPLAEIQKHLLPEGQRFSMSWLLKLAAMGDAELAAALAARKITLDAQIPDLEVQHAKALLDSAVLLLHQHPLSVDVILGYLFAKEVEIRNLRMIIMGKHLGVDEGFMERNLVIGG